MLALSLAADISARVPLAAIYDELHIVDKCSMLTCAAVLA